MTHPVHLCQILIPTEAYDGHFWIGLCSLSQLSFIRPDLRLVSFANDSNSLPRVYLRTDMEDGYEPSPIDLMNGENAESYIMRYSLLSGNFHDPDALYNSMFDTIQTGSGGITHYPLGEYEPYTTVTFDNGKRGDRLDSDAFYQWNLTYFFPGTTVVYDTIAIVSQPELWTSVNSAGSFIETFCVNSTRFGNTTSDQSTPPADPTPPIDTPPVPTRLEGYPEPALPFYDKGSFAGYFLDSNGWGDVAVCSFHYVA